MKLRVFTAQDRKMLSIFLTATALCIVTGFAAGFMYGTGSSIVSLFVQPEVISPPPAVAVTKIDNVTSVLSQQPKIAYQAGYNCIDFAWSAMRTLQWQGQPSAIVRLGFPDGTGHAILLVPTSDKGYQFVEPQTNEVVRVVPGSIYDGKVVANMTILEFTWKPFDIFVIEPQYGLVGWEDPK